MAGSDFGGEYDGAGRLREQGDNTCVWDGFARLLKLAAEAGLQTYTYHGVSTGVKRLYFQRSK